MAKTSGPPSFGAQQERDPNDEAMLALARQSPRDIAMARQAETAAAALATAARAQVEARYVMALQRPRSWEKVRQDILNECARPRFAEVARYHKPIGKGVEGPSIRFAEMALRNMANVMPENAIILDDDRRRTIRVTVTDLESNVTYSQDVMVDKTVERRDVKDGQEVISQRTNSYGKVTYLVPATEDDLLNKQNALVSKALRTLALRLLPGDILDEAMERVIDVQRNQDAIDPTAARRRCADSFSKLGITVKHLSEYLGHTFDEVTSEEIVELRAIWQALNDKETRWSEVMEGRTAKAEAPQEKPAAAPTDGKKPPPESVLPKPAPKPEPAKTAPAPEPTKAAEPKSPPAKTQEQLDQEREAEEAERALAAREKEAQAAKAVPAPDAPKDPPAPKAKKAEQPGFAIPGFVSGDQTKKPPPRDPGQEG